MAVNALAPKMAKLVDNNSPTVLPLRAAGSVHRGQSPADFDSAPLTNITVHDLNKMMWENFAKMQQVLSVNMMQSLQSLVPEIVKNNTKELSNDVQNIKKEYADMKLILRF
jgi:hypothetical protein